jgi:uncharacterized membrane protein
VVGLLLLALLICCAWPGSCGWRPPAAARWPSRCCRWRCALPGLLRHRLYTYRWLSLLVWLYVTEGLVRGDQRPRAVGLAGGAEVALAWRCSWPACTTSGCAVPLRPKTSTTAKAT